MIALQLKITGCGSFSGVYPVTRKKAGQTSAPFKFRVLLPVVQTGTVTSLPIMSMRTCLLQSLYKPEVVVSYPAFRLIHAVDRTSLDCYLPHGPSAHPRTVNERLQVREWTLALVAKF